ncbi:hypothetical protein GM182_07080 [bacterium 3DAC]|nr:hypothetical protein GM182_07080 [bacterium 3DAC]
MVGLGYIVWLGEEGSTDVSLVGGKAASLGHLVSAGMPVPKGFVLSSEAYERVITMCGIDGLIKSGASPREIREAIKSCDLPDEIKEELKLAYEKLGGVPVAVRSSATVEDTSAAAFAGQYETVLDVKGVDDVIRAVKICYASVWGDRVVDYREKRGISHNEVKMAVLVQEMVHPDISGVMFTANPISGRRNETVINVIKGIGELMVSGLKTPEVYVIRHGWLRMSVVEHTVGDDGDILSPKWAYRLATMGQKLEDYFGAYQDVEWAIKNDKLYILQSRPITTLPIPKLKMNIAKLNAFRIISEMLTRRPYPAEGDFMNIVFRDAVINPFAPLGIRVGGVRKNMLIWKNGMPAVLDYFLWTTPHGVAEFIVTPMLPLAPLTLIVKGLIANAKDWKKDPMVKKTEDVKADIERYVPKTPKERLFYIKKAMQMTTIAGKLRSKYLYSSMLHFALLRVWLKVMKKEHHLGTLAFTGLDTVITRSNRELEKLADMIRKNEYLRELFEKHTAQELVSIINTDKRAKDFRRAFDKFLREYGYREAGSVLYMSDGMWIDRPEVPLQIIKGLVIGDRSVEDNTIYENALMEVMSHPLMKVPFFRKRFVHTLMNARQFQVLREDTRYMAMIPSHFLRRMYLDMGKSLYDKGFISSPEDIFFIRFHEVVKDEKTMAKIIKDRKKLWYKLEKLPFIDISPLKQETTADDNVIITGIPGSPGIGRGKVCVIRSQDEFDKMEEGAILVAPYTTPAWTPLFALASGVVVDTGGPLSHAAIVAREYGIPAVMGTGEATKVLKDGMYVEVDGSNGVVRRGE